MDDCSPMLHWEHIKSNEAFDQDVQCPTPRVLEVRIRFFGSSSGTQHPT